MSGDYRFSRRALLARLGASGAFVPLLSAHKSFAQVAASPKRLVIIQWTNGVEPASFFPQGGETNFTLPSSLTPLQPYKNDVIVMGGVDLTVALQDPLGHRTIVGHQSLPHLLTGALSAKTNIGGENEQDRIKGNAISIDQHIAKAVAARTKLPLSSLELGVQSTGSFTNSDVTEAVMSFNGPSTNPSFADANKPDESPYSVFKRLFEGQSLDVGQIDKLRRERKSVLDVVGRNLESLRLRLGTEDRQAVEKHLGSIRQVEMELDALGGGGGVVGACTATAPAAGIDLKDKSRFRDLVNAQFDLMVLALKCDLTRVVTFMFPNANGSGTSLAFLGGQFTQPAQDKDLSYASGAISHHEITHAGGPMKAEADKWFISMFADVIKRFKATPDAAGGTLFDRSVLLMANHMGVGAAHSPTNVPFIIAGNAGGYYKTGRWLDFAGTAHNGLLASLARAMDVPTDSFGDARYNTTTKIDTRLRG